MRASCSPQNVKNLRDDKKIAGRLLLDGREEIREREGNRRKDILKIHYVSVV